MHYVHQALTSLKLALSLKILYLAYIVEKGSTQPIMEHPYVNYVRLEHSQIKSDQSPAHHVQSVMSGRTRAGTGWPAKTAASNAKLDNSQVLGDLQVALFALLVNFRIRLRQAARACVQLFAFQAHTPGLGLVCVFHAVSVNLLQVLV